MKVSSQLDGVAAVLLKKKPPVSIEWELGSASGPEVV